MEGHLDSYLAWYGRFFEDAGPDQIRGEGSTTYMPSVKAPARIAQLTDLLGLEQSNKISLEEQLAQLRIDLADGGISL